MWNQSLKSIYKVILKIQATEWSHCRAWKCILVARFQVHQSEERETEQETGEKGGNAKTIGNNGGEQRLLLTQMKSCFWLIFYLLYLLTLPVSSCTSFFCLSLSPPLSVLRSSTAASFFPAFPSVLQPRLPVHVIPHIRSRPASSALSFFPASFAARDSCCTDSVAVIVTPDFKNVLLLTMEGLKHDCIII